jgi:hypothetical protein
MGLTVRIRVHLTRACASKRAHSLVEGGLGAGMDSGGELVKGEGAWSDLVSVLFFFKRNQGVLYLFYYCIYIYYCLVL